MRCIGPSCSNSRPCGDSVAGCRSCRRVTRAERRPLQPLDAPRRRSSGTMVVFAPGRSTTGRRPGRCRPAAPDRPARSAAPQRLHRQLEVAVRAACTTRPRCCSCCCRRSRTRNSRRWPAPAAAEIAADRAGAQDENLHPRTVDAPASRCAGRGLGEPNPSSLGAGGDAADARRRGLSRVVVMRATLAPRLRPGHSPVGDCCHCHAPKLQHRGSAAAPGRGAGAAPGRHWCRGAPVEHRARQVAPLDQA